jgi:hypothetical protein
MPSRRRLLSVTAALLPLTGCTFRSAESGNIQVANRTGQEVRITITVWGEGGLLSGAQVVYEDTYRQFPTKHHRATLTDVVRPGTYRVRVDVETKEGRTETRTKPEWNVRGETSEALVIAIESGLDIELLTQ